MKKTPIILSLLLAVSASVFAVNAIAISNPIPSIGLVVRKNPGGSTERMQPTGVDGSFKIKDLPVGKYDVFVGTCTPITIDIAQDNNVMSGSVTRDGEFMMYSSK